MRTPALAAIVLATAAGGLAAQPNPFEIPKAKVPAVHVRYAMTGDMAGQGELAMEGSRMADRSTTTMTMLGKTTTTDRFTLTTPDSTWTADVGAKKGTVMPNVLPLMAEAYDDLDGRSKKRLHENMREMTQMFTQAFGATSLAGAGEKGSKRTIAGQECEERTLIGISICSMTRAPAVALEVKGSLLCFDYAQTATEVQLGSPPASAFEKPAGITWGPDPNLQNPDSLARGFVGYLASQALTDSLAAAKQQAPPETVDGEPAREPTPEEKAQMREACEAMKNFSVGRMMSNATSSFANEMAKAAAEAAKDEARRGVEGGVRRGIRGIFK
jgi:hypothetical protein